MYSEKIHINHKSDHGSALPKVSRTHLIFHKVVKDITVKLSNVVGYNGQINTLHLGFELVFPCCWVLLFSRGTLLDLDTKNTFRPFSYWLNILYVILQHFFIFQADLTAGSVLLILLVPLALAFLVHLHFGLRHSAHFAIFPSQITCK